MPPLNRLQKTCLALALGHAAAHDTQAATIEVDTNLDAIDPREITACTLRKAINSFDSGVPLVGCTATGRDSDSTDTIVFAANLANSTITLAGQALTVSNDTKVSDITVQGNGITIGGNGQSSVFEVNNNNRLSLDSVALTNGKRFTGGAIDFRSGAHVSLSNCKLSGNTSYGGGAIYALDATLEVSDCVISDNTASSSTANGGGGYIRNSLARFSRVTFDSNLVTREAYSEGPPSGGGLFVRGGEVTIEDSTFSNNRADGNSFGGYGGALGASSSAVIKLSRTTVSDNFARNNGGGIVGRLGVRSIELTNSTVSGNSAGRSGGGIFQSGSLVLTNSTISANTAANNGGGFFLSLASLTIANSLVAGNKASSLGSELYISSAGLTNSGVNLFGTTGRNSIFGFTPAAKDITVDISSPSRLSQIISPLTNNGGFNFTHALPVGSPAIDMADSSICATTVIDNVDQRGETRDANCDIGAYELTQPASSFFVVPAKNGNTLIFEL